MTEAEGPAHIHTLAYSTGTGAGYYLNRISSNNATAETMGYQSTVPVGRSGSGTPHNNMPPYTKVCTHVRAG